METIKPSMKSSSELGFYQILLVLIVVNIFADVSIFLLCFSHQKYTFHISQQQKVV